MRILYKYTSRSRPEKFFRGLDSIFKMSKKTTQDDMVVMVTLDVDDPTMRDESVFNRIKEYPNTTCFYGISKNKIDAINRDIPLAPKFDILVNFSDDQIFTKRGFDEIIRNDMIKSEHLLDTFLHYKDPYVFEKLPTMSIMGVDYFNRFNYIYHPDYNSVYADNEAMDVAKILKRHVLCDETIYDHLHPVWGKSEWDEQYRATEHPETYAKDRATYYSRKKNKFNL